MGKFKKRKSEARDSAGAKKQKTVAAPELYSFIESTIKLVTSLPTAIDFIKLPPKKLLADYYETIDTPISIHEIKQKYNNKAYQSAEDFLADFQLMADNANTYNVEDSEIARNSIMILNFVKDQVSQYTSKKEPTPGSEEEEADIKQEDNQEDEDDEYNEDSDSDKKKPSTPAKSGLKIKIKAPAAPSTPAQTPGTPGTPASGMTQKARFLMVLDELMNYTVDGVVIGKPFTNEVSRREFPDYYHVVKKPMALGTVRDNILAGKVKSMGQFQNQVELVWKNAQLYNEPGTLLYSDSRVLQDYFHARMAEINREIEAARVALLQQRDTPGPSLKLKLKPPKTKLSLTLHNRQSGGLSIPGEMGIHGHSLLNPLTGETQKIEDPGSSEEEETSQVEEEEAKPETPAVKLPSTKPRGTASKSKDERYIQEINFSSSRSLYKQLQRPLPNAPLIQTSQNWFEHTFEASDIDVSSYTLSLHRQQGAVSVSLGLHDSLVEKKHQSFLTVNGERVNPVPSIHYADTGRRLSSRFELKLPIGLNMVVFDVAVEDATEEARTRLQEAATIKREKMTFWVQVL
ncbi:Protein polybromo-1 [Cyberlindnera fabianii]|uniref:Protein polybromo-1 n=1 Tax=Cyberlindnera fabianii TaxID=36022 RepID=A0A1V2L9R6_CYBFA|nr:Protein polybromo-1 [Cyberlindnera fabianii]